MAVSVDARKVVSRRNALRQLRLPHESIWTECFDFTHPMRGVGFTQDGLSSSVHVANLNAKIYDGTAPDSAVVLASNVVDGMTPANTIWFALDAGTETSEEQRWLDDTARVLWENIHSSNFDAVSFEAALDAVDAGWFVMYIDEDRENGGLVFEQWPLSQCTISASKSTGLVDTVYRTYAITAEQALNDFGEDMLHPDVARLARDNPQEMVEFVHAIEPRSTYVIGAKLAKNMRFRSCHVDAKNMHVCRESGYHEFPCVVPRWHKIPGSAYAVGPVYNALPDIRTVNKVRQQELMAQDMAIAGTYIAVDDGVLNPRSIKIGARKVIVANDVDSIKPLTNSSQFDVAFMSEDRLQASIRKTLMADQLPPADGPAKTAYEYSVRVAMIRKLLGPVYGRLQSEYLKPLIERCFGIAYRAGVFAPPPQSLTDRVFTVKYLSPLARAQKIEEVNAIDEYVDKTLATYERTQDESILDTVDFDEAQRFRSKALGVPSAVVPDKRAIARKRNDRRQAQQAQQQQAQDGQMSAMAAEAALKQSRPAA